MVQHLHRADIAFQLDVPPPTDGQISRRRHDPVPLSAGVSMDLTVHEERYRPFSVYR
jgi:hypothetical protein